MLDKTTFIVCGNSHLNQTIASIRFGKWGVPLPVDIRFIEYWRDIHELKQLKKYAFMIKAGTVFTDIELFFAELDKALLKTGIGHLIYDKSTNSVCLHDQAMLVESKMIPQTFGISTKITFPDVRLSGKNIHHDYTPTYVTVKNRQMQTQIGKSKFGQDVIANYLKEKQYFINFPKKLRHYKVYLPDSHVKDPFIEYRQMIENSLWVFNNDPLLIKNTSKVICTAGGIGWMLQTANEIEICDISKVQLEYIDECINVWEGENFGQFVHRFILKRKLQHFHVNLNEDPGPHSSIDLLKDRDKFINLVNKNFQTLLKKYRPGVSTNDLLRELRGKKIICRHANILDHVQKYLLVETNLSNIMNFKYNFVTNNIDSWQNLISPVTKAFIKACKNPKKNPYPDVPCEPIDLNVPVDVIREEILSMRDYLVPHRPESGIGWSSFCIHGKSIDATKEDPFYADDRPHSWTKPALENMPKTVEWLKTLGYKSFRRVRVMCLAPKSFINVHRDSADSKLGPINVAITHPAGCKFYLEHHGELHFKPGKAYRMNLVNYHTVVNYSNDYRYHIIIHGNQ